jgi:hypothetical protein
MGMRHFTPPLAPGQTAVMLADFPALNMAMLIGLIFVQIVYVTMVYGPIAAFLVELFPTNIRYTSMSLPYHLGNGWFGGFLPLIATAVAASPATREAFGSGAIYAGLIYPIAIALVTLVVGGLFIIETKDHKIDTAIRSRGEGVEPFDWTAVLLALAAGFALLLVARAGFWTSLIAAAALFALPTVFLRLEFGRARSLLTLAACLMLTAGLSYLFRPVFVSMGGMFKFFANTLPLGIYTAVLAVAFWIGRPRRLRGVIAM